MENFAGSDIDFLKFRIVDPGGPIHAELRKIRTFKLINDDQGRVVCCDRKLVKVSETVISGLDGGDGVVEAVEYERVSLAHTAECCKNIPRPERQDRPPFISLYAEVCHGGKCVACTGPDEFPRILFLAL